MEDRVDKKKIVVYTRYSVEEAKNVPIDSKKPFIIANERVKEDKTIGRSYTVFMSFADFLTARRKFPHCHEIFADHVKAKPNLGGRLVFDFDIKTDIPPDFKDQIQNVVWETVDKYFLPRIDRDRLQYVWSTSPNPAKVSKHLTVKHLYFDDWLEMSKLFYHYFSKMWQESGYDWITAEKLVDFQIARKTATLRMVGSSKIGGSKLVLDDPKHTLEDSLIRIYRRSTLKEEQIVRMEDLGKGALQEIPTFEKRSAIVEYRKVKSTVVTEPTYPREIYDKAFEKFIEIFQDGKKYFEMGKIRGSLISLTRIEPSVCIMSGIVHEHENAFLVINPNTRGLGHYRVKYGCHRRCNENSRTFVLFTFDKDLVNFYPRNPFGTGYTISTKKNTKSITKGVDY